jgi:hypothetical protein
MPGALKLITFVFRKAELNTVDVLPGADYTWSSYRDFSLIN